MAYTEVILREQIEGLGSEADIVKVRRGFARNFLVPQGKALEATKGNLRHLEALGKARKAREAKELALAQKIASKIKRTKLQMKLHTGQKGKAFGSITVTDVVKALANRIGEKVDRHLVKLDKPIKTTGSFDLPVKLHPEVKVSIRVRVTAEEDESASKS